MELDQQLNYQSGFRHPPIDPKTQVRLLRSLPSKPQSPIPTTSREPTTLRQEQIRFIFEVVALKDLEKTSYRALSYTWGTVSSITDDLFEVLVEGQSFWVRRNLYEFLVSSPSTENHDDHDSRRQRGGGGGLMFIDAICIDQLGDERQAQVHLMREIYRRADGVISWLGVPPDEATRNSVRALAGTLKDGRAGTTSPTEWTPEERAGYRYMSYNRYWTRVWVLQEILLGREVTVCCGEWVFPLRLFASRGWDNTRVVIRRDHGKTPAERVTTYRLRTVLCPAATKKDALAQGVVVLPLDQMVFELRRKGSAATWETREYQTQLPDSLLDIMARYGHLECSDSRDKLYGFLGLLAEKSQKGICVDYGRGADFTFYQGLKVGIVELVQEMEADLVISWSLRERAASRNKIDSFYRDLRQAFGEALGAGEADRIRRDVLAELQIEGWLAEVDPALTFREHGYESEVISWRDYRKLCDGGRGVDMERLNDRSWLDRWHSCQERAVNKVKRKLGPKMIGCGD
ncbi:Heterokaryon incompatibility protein (HET) domain containing protein [Rhypophila sp. PSN 637]